MSHDEHGKEVDIDQVAFIETLQREIAERKRIEYALRAEEERFKSIFNNSMIGLYRTTPDGQILLANPALVRMMGYSSLEDLARINLEKEGYEKGYSRALFKQEIEKEGKIIGYESAWLRRDNKTLFVRESAIAIRNESGKTLYYEGTVEDITDRKLSEDKIKTAIREKEVLLRELHHRVKNNLQVIGSLISLQSQNISDEKALESFKGLADRVRIFALIHENLYQSEDISKIDLNEYLGTLTTHLNQASMTKNIKFHIDIEKIYLDVKPAISCGLIVNELVSNSLKYAFSQKEEGTISITCSYTDQGLLSLIVCDDGIGYQEGFESKKTLGLRIIRLMASQLKGKVEFHSNNGAQTKIEFQTTNFI